MKYKKAMFSLPEPLLEKLSKYSEMVSDGNKSGFVAEALEAHMEYIRKAQHTMKLRESYKAASKRNQAILREWRHVDAETARKLDKADEEGLS